MKEWIKLSQKTSRLVLGLMSGTSLDGVDLALCKITGQGAKMDIRLKAFATHPMPLALKKRIQSSFLGQPEELCRLNFDLGEFFAQSVLQFCHVQGLAPKEIDIIGSHGQTIWHVPGHSTLQIGEGAVIAAMTGVPVISDFRVADMAKGGEGAPLVSYLDRALFADPQRNLALHNLGGISNFTYLPASGEVFALDTGPGNAPLNELTERVTQGKLNFDKDGAIAAQGKVLPDLLAEMLTHPYFAKPLPKSTGREEFGAPFIEALLQKHPQVSPPDFMRTLVALVAQSSARAYRQYAPAVEKIWVSGGGMHNPVLLAALREAVGVPLEPLPASQALNPDAKEAVAFALFAHEWFNGQATNLPEVTGAKGLARLGKLSLP